MRGKLQSGAAEPILEALDSSQRRKKGKFS
jgi:hypothetical protein